jgi:hypothetical protein
MSLTHKTYQERKWGDLPELRKMIENKKIKDSDNKLYWGFTSADDNTFDYLNRVFEILVLVEENQKEIIESTNEATYDQIIKDINHVAKASKSVAYDFEQKIDNLHKIMYKIEEKREIYRCSKR